MGNSEVGHLNLGAGAIVKQDLLRIDEAIEDGSFFENEALRRGLPRAERLHLLGLVSAGGVHASMDHLRALIELAGREGVPDVVLHAFTDGRDTLPDSGAGYLAEVEGLGRRAHREPSPAATTRWTATSAGTAPSSPTTRSSTGEAEFTRRQRRGRGPGRLRARRDRRVHQADARGGGGAHPRRRQRDLLQLPARPARGS